jgi:hypothetical protein
VRLLAAVLLCGCGRFAFDPQSDAIGDASFDTAVDTGLRLHFTFEPASFLDELAGGHDGTCTSCPTPVAGHAGGGAQFDGVDNCVYIDNDIRPAAFTIALWENTVDIRQQTLFGRSRNAATDYVNSFEIYAMSSSSDLYFIAQPTTLQMQRPLGSWHHLAAVFDGSVFTTYLDGVQFNQGSPQVAVEWTADLFRIGCDMDNGVEQSHYKGTLDDVRFYDRALSAAEVAQLATE